jgi:hypothetical protein
MRALHLTNVWSDGVAGLVGVDHGLHAVAQTRLLEDAGDGRLRRCFADDELVAEWSNASCSRVAGTATAAGATSTATRGEPHATPWSSKRSPGSAHRSANTMPKEAPAFPANEPQELDVTTA